MENMGTNDKTREKKAGNRVLKAGIGYTIGNYLLKGLSFFTIPIFTRLLTTQLMESTTFFFPMKI